ncbi:hypothetical protein EJB05_43549, partial [Eragrostis curvula]
MPVLNMLLVTGVGSFLASDFAGILTKEARKHLNNLVFYVFNPSLIASYLAKTVTPESLGKLQFAFMDAGNMGNVFLIVIPALCKEKGSPFGAPEACQTYGLAYSSLSLAIGAVFLWLIVYNIIRVTSKLAEESSDAQTNEAEVLNSGIPTGPISDGNKFSTSDTNDWALPLISADIRPIKSKVPFSERARLFLTSIFGTAELKRLLPPSTIAAIVGLVIGVTSLIRNALIGENAPLRAVQGSVELIGAAAIPSVALIMGGNLLNGVRGGARVDKSVIAGVVMVRYILLPLVGIGLVKGAIRVGLVQPDPLYQFILMLQYAVPPAMNIGTMTQLFGVGTSECSVIFVWAYALASVAVTAWSSVFMWTLSA